VEELTRFDTATHAGVDPVVVSHLLPPDPFVVIIPLLRDYPAIPRLVSKVTRSGREFFLATRLIGPVRRASLRRTGSVADQADLITRVIDVLMEGFRPSPRQPIP
jgi:toxin CcdB